MILQVGRACVSSESPSRWLRGQVLSIFSHRKLIHSFVGTKKWRIRPYGFPKNPCILPYETSQMWVNIPWMIWDWWNLIAKGKPYRWVEQIDLLKVWVWFDYVYMNMFQLGWNHLFLLIIFWGWWWFIGLRNIVHLQFNESADAPNLVIFAWCFLALIRCSIFIDYWHNRRNIWCWSFNMGP